VRRGRKHTTQCSFVWLLCHIGVRLLGTVHCCFVRRELLCDISFVLCATTGTTTVIVLSVVRQGPYHDAQRQTTLQTLFRDRFAIVYPILHTSIVPYHHHTIVWHNRGKNQQDHGSESVLGWVEYATTLSITTPKKSW
jgi:hypothetical protein